MIAAVDWWARGLAIGSMVVALAALSIEAWRRWDEVRSRKSAALLFHLEQAQLLSARIVVHNDGPATATGIRGEVKATGYTYGGSFEYDATLPPNAEDAVMSFDWNGQDGFPFTVHYTWHDGRKREQTGEQRISKARPRSRR